MSPASSSACGARATAEALGTGGEAAGLTGLARTRRRHPQQVVESRHPLTEARPLAGTTTTGVAVQRGLQPGHAAATASEVSAPQRVGRCAHLYLGIFDAVQLIPHWRREQVFVQLPCRARPPAITLVRLTLATLDAKREGTLVMTDG
jgi:hypothetical protein